MKKRIYTLLLTTILSINTFTPFIVSANTLSTKEQVISEDLVNARKSDLQFLIKNLEEKHPDIYNKNDKEVFDEKVKEIENNLHKMDNFEFVIALSELVALIGDSHTKVSLNSVTEEVLQIPLGLVQVEEGIMIVTIDDKNKEVLGGILTSINGISIEEVKEKIMPLFSYDNQTYLDANFLGHLNIYNILEYYGITKSPKDISLEVKLGNEIKNIKIDAVPIEEMSKVKLEKLQNNIPTKKDKEKIYFKNELDKDTLYIQYNSCRQDENLPMKNFANQVNEDIENNGYKKVIVDLRYNGGGSDGVIMPLMYNLEEKIKQEGLVVYTLIGSNTFSSALINAVEFKEIGATIVGTNTGGSVDHFGEVDVFELPNTKIQVRYSNKFFDLATLLEAAESYGMESFKPDIYKQQTREDYLQGKDTAVEYILKDTSKNTPKLNLNRGQLAVEIGRDCEIRKAGKPINSLSYKFEDINKISYIAPYVAYINENKIMVGENEKQFLPDREVTKGELAVVLMRYANLLNIPLNNIQKENVQILDINSSKSWQQEAIKTFADTSIFPLENGNFNANEVVTVEQFENIFNEFLKIVK